MQYTFMKRATNLQFWMKNNLEHFLGFIEKILHLSRNHKFISILYGMDEEGLQLHQAIKKSR